MCVCKSKKRKKKAGAHASGAAARPTDRQTHTRPSFPRLLPLFLPLLQHLCCCCRYRSRRCATADAPSCFSFFHRPVRIIKTQPEIKNNELLLLPLLLLLYGGGGGQRAGAGERWRRRWRRDGRKEGAPAGFAGLQLMSSTHSRKQTCAGRTDVLRLF